MISNFKWYTNVELSKKGHLCSGVHNFLFAYTVALAIEPAVQLLFAKCYYCTLYLYVFMFYTFPSTFTYLVWMSSGQLIIMFYNQLRFESAFEG